MLCKQFGFGALGFSRLPFCFCFVGVFGGGFCRCFSSFRFRFLRLGLFLRLRFGGKTRLTLGLCGFGFRLCFCRRLLCLARFRLGGFLFGLDLLQCRFFLVGENLKFFILLLLPPYVIT